jgi:hypothetical protein
LRGQIVRRNNVLRRGVHSDDPSVPHAFGRREARPFGIAAHGSPRVMAKGDSEYCAIEEIDAPGKRSAVNAAPGSHRGSYRSAGKKRFACRACGTHSGHGRRRRTVPGATAQGQLARRRRAPKRVQCYFQARILTRSLRLGRNTNKSPQNGSSGQGDVRIQGVG